MWCKLLWKILGILLQLFIFPVKVFIKKKSLSGIVCFLEYPTNKNPGDLILVIGIGDSLLFSYQKNKKLDLPDFLFSCCFQTTPNAYHHVNYKNQKCGLREDGNQKKKYLWPKCTHPKCLCKFSQRWNKGQTQLLKVSGYLTKR